MKKLVFLLIILLVLWIAGASWWYVCRTRCDCRNSPALNEYSSAQDAARSAQVASVEEAKTFLTSAGMQNVFFETSRASTESEIIPAGYLAKLKLYLENHPEARVTVTGHADKTGPEDFNIMLSNLRARYVKTYLVMSGIGADQIVTSGKGFSQPVASDETRDGRARNRRTEINIIN